MGKWTSWNWVRNWAIRFHNCKFTILLDVHAEDLICVKTIVNEKRKKTDEKFDIGRRYVL